MPGKDLLNCKEVNNKISENYLLIQKYLDR